MYYIIYRIHNLVNGKCYIGKHKTDNLNDGYMGSGKNIKRAIKKYGIENFIKEIVCLCNSKESMNQMEKSLVSPIIPKLMYNIAPGGKGGWDYVNTQLTKKHRQEGRKKADMKIFEKYGVYNSSQIPYVREKLKNRIVSEETRRKLSESQIGEKSYWYGKKHTKITKHKISQAQKLINRFGSNNPSFGTCWITNEVENKKIKKKELDYWITQGYYKGRKIF